MEMVSEAYDWTSRAMRAVAWLNLVWLLVMRRAVKLTSRIMNQRVGSWFVKAGARKLATPPSGSKGDIQRIVGDGIERTKASKGTGITTLRLH